jgi:transposase
MGAMKCRTRRDSIRARRGMPAEPYVFAEWKECRVGLDYHVEIEKHYYSVPHQLLRETVWARITARTIEVFHCGQRVAAHVRSSSNRKHTTLREHMPSSHRRYADWTPERLRRQAEGIGRHTSALVEIILRERTHPEQGFRACVGILRLAKTYGREPALGHPQEFHVSLPLDQQRGATRGRQESATEAGRRAPFVLVRAPCRNAC